LSEEANKQLITEHGVVSPGSPPGKCDTDFYSGPIQKIPELNLEKIPELNLDNAFHFNELPNKHIYEIKSPIKQIVGTPWLTSSSAGGIPVVVIPAALGGIEQIPLLFNAAVRDLNIMCRLFDNRLKLSKPDNTDPFNNIFYYRSDQYLDPLRSFWGRKTRNTNCIYIEGYGALFLMRANIPLTAPQQSVKPKEKPSEPIDKVWRQTESELYGSKNVQTDQPGKGYDTNMVEEFKTNIVKTLKHAANIKCLKSDELVIVTVNDPQKKAGPPGVLIVRAKKSDIDEFSKGTLDLDSFREKVQIVAPPRAKDARGSEQATDKPDTAEGTKE
jgi:hypothetical protein